MTNNKSQHETRLKAVQRPERVEEWRYKLLLEALSKTILADGDRSQQQKVQ